MSASWDLRRDDCKKHNDPEDRLKIHIARGTLMKNGEHLKIEADKADRSRRAIEVSGEVARCVRKRGRGRRMV